MEDFQKSMITNILNLNHLKNKNAHHHELNTKDLHFNLTLNLYFKKIANIFFLK